MVMAFAPRSRPVTTLLILLVAFGPASTDLYLPALPEIARALGSDAGAAYLLLGPATGTIDLATVGSKALGVAGDDWAGQAVSTAGDIDNDGFDDVLIGVPFSDDWDTDAGQIWVVRGGGW